MIALIALLANYCSPYDALEENSQNYPLGECEQALSPTQRDYMTLLSPYYKHLFCAVFNDQQRNEAILMTGMLDTNGDPMTADNAVAQTAQNNGVLLNKPPEEPPCAPYVQPPH